MRARYHYPDTKRLDVAITVSSGSFLTEIPIRSPQKKKIHYLKNNYVDQSIQRIVYLILKTEALTMPGLIGTVLSSQCFGKIKYCWISTF